MEGSSPQTFLAVRTQTVEQVRALIAEGKLEPLTLNATLQTLVFYAVQNPSCALDMCKLLIEEHSVEPDHVDSSGQTALFYLAKTDHCDCLAFLVRRGCDVNHVDNLGQIALFYAAAKGKPEMVRKLVWEGSDPNHADKLGQTALCYSHSGEVLRALLNSGADPTSRDATGRTVAEVLNATSTANPEMNAFMDAASHIQKVRGRVAWTYGADASMFLVQLAQPADVDRLCALEEEFVQDHREILQSVTKLGAAEEIYSIIGLCARAETRRATIMDIAMSQKSPHGQRRDFTMQCVHIMMIGGSYVATVVGYMYFKLQDKPVQTTSGSQKLQPFMVIVSHLKVDRQFQGRGCATLLIAGMLRFLEKKGAQAYMQQLQLSVVKGNTPARRFYEKLGFVEILCEGSPVAWLTMVRAVGLAISYTLRGWLALVPGGACGQGTAPKAKRVNRRANPAALPAAIEKSNDGSKEADEARTVEESVAPTPDGQRMSLKRKAQVTAAGPQKVAAKHFPQSTARRMTRATAAKLGQ